MPPRSITSAAALVGLCSLAAVETGACSNSSKSLASVTRTGLPLLTMALRGPIVQLSIKKLSRAVTTQEPGPDHDGDSEVTELFVEHGLGPMSELSPHCGRYEFKDDGKVVAWDALVSSQPPERILTMLSKGEPTLSFTHPANGVWVADRQVAGKAQHVQLHSSDVAKLPENCRELRGSVRSVVIVAEAL